MPIDWGVKPTTNRKKTNPYRVDGEAMCDRQGCERSELPCFIHDREDTRPKALVLLQSW